MARDAEAQVVDETASDVGRKIELGRDVRIDPDAREVDEEPAAERPHVYSRRPGAKRVGDRQLRTQVDAQLGRQAITGSGRDDAQRHVAERQR